MKLGVERACASVYNLAMEDIQLENLWRITRLNVVALRLTGVSCDYCKVCAGDGEDGSTVVGVRVEAMMLLGLLCH